MISSMDEKEIWSKMYPDYLRMPEPVPAAFRTAARAHEGQADRAGRPYIFHPMTVAAGVGGDPDAVAAALLHDVVEDTDVTEEDIRRMFPESVAEAVRLLTHEDGVPYMDYVRRVKESGNETAIRVKISDLCTNMNAARLPDPRSADQKRRLTEKYLPALKLLLDL